MGCQNLSEDSHIRLHERFKLFQKVSNVTVKISKEGLKIFRLQTIALLRLGNKCHDIDNFSVCEEKKEKMHVVH